MPECDQICRPGETRNRFSNTQGNLTVFKRVCSWGFLDSLAGYRGQRFCRWCHSQCGR